MKKLKEQFDKIKFLVSQEKRYGGTFVVIEERKVRVVSLFKYDSILFTFKEKYHGEEEVSIWVDEDLKDLKHGQLRMFETLQEAEAYALNLVEEIKEKNVEVIDRQVEKINK